MPVGNTDLMGIRETGLYYINKTMHIDQFAGRSYAKVTIFTKLRCFGKSLDLSMPHHFFDIGEDRLSEGLQIYENKKLCDNWLNKGDTAQR